MNIKKFVGKQVRKAREELGISQEILGEKTNYAGPTISQLESGQFRLSLESLEKIAKVLNKPLSFFLPENMEKDYTLPSKLTAVERELAEIKKTITKGAVRAREGFFHVVVTGNIGAGKTVLVKKLAKYYNGKFFLIDDLGNPYLPRYYQDMGRWALHSQLYFIAESFRIHSEIDKSIIPVFQDRSVHEQFSIFATSLYEQGILDGLDYRTLQSLYSSVKNLIQVPDLVIYLKMPVPELLKRIKERGRVYEKNITAEYLEHLNQKHDQWVGSFDLCSTVTIPVDELDFVHKPSDFKFILKKIDAAL